MVIRMLIFTVITIFKQIFLSEIQALVEVRFMCCRVFTSMGNEGGGKFNQEFAGVTFCDLNQIAFHYREFERAAGSHLL